MRARTIQEVAASSMQIKRLFTLLRKHSKPPKPELLGRLGKKTLRKCLEGLYGELRDFHYGIDLGVCKQSDFEVPYVLEAAFCRLNSENAFAISLKTHTTIIKFDQLIFDGNSSDIYSHIRSLKPLKATINLEEESGKARLTKISHLGLNSLISLFDSTCTKSLALFKTLDSLNSSPGLPQQDLIGDLFRYVNGLSAFMPIYFRDRSWQDLSNLSQDSILCSSGARF
jgi:hypothetical protein